MASEEFDFKNPKEGIQKWLVAFREPTAYHKHWTSFEIPGLLSQRTIELIFSELNEFSDIVYARVVMGVQEPKKHKIKKGEFLGL